MLLDNRCNALVVYGSYAPGGENHHILSGLPGTWEKGSIRVDLIDPPDGIGPDENDVIEAWRIEFADCQADPLTYEMECILHERWTCLDKAMGEEFVRDAGVLWWTDRKKTGSLNIYFPQKYSGEYSLGYDYDIPSPKERDDARLMWQQQRSGKKHFEEHHFLTLIKDAHAIELDKLFSDLKGGGPFLDKLKTFFSDHELHEGSISRDADGSCLIYVLPLARNAQPKGTMVELARQEIDMFRGLLEVGKYESYRTEAKALEHLQFEFGSEPENEWSREDPALAALNSAADLRDGILECEEPWFDAIREACYGIAASFGLQAWLLSDWTTADEDFTSSYEFWKAGGAYRVEDGICHVFELGRQLG